MKGINNRQKAVVKARQTPEKNLLSARNLTKGRKPGINARTMRLLAAQKKPNQQ